MLTNLTPTERERIAYTEGFTEAARLLAQLAEAELDRDLYLEALQAIYEGIKGGSMTSSEAMMLAARVIP
jgi:hypothetical protein